MDAGHLWAFIVILIYYIKKFHSVHSKVLCHSKQKVVAPTTCMYCQLVQDNFYLIASPYYVLAWIIRLQFYALTTTSWYENDVTWFCIGKNCGILLTFTTYSVWLLPHQQLMLRRTKKECFHTLFANTLPPPKTLPNNTTWN